MLKWKCWNGWKRLKEGRISHSEKGRHKRNQNSRRSKTAKRERTLITTPDDFNRNLTMLLDAVVCKTNTLERNTKPIYRFEIRYLLFLNSPVSFSIGQFSPEQKRRRKDKFYKITFNSSHSIHTHPSQFSLKKKKKVHLHSH